jgi:hypothetical protein
MTVLHVKFNASSLSVPALPTVKKKRHSIKITDLEVDNGLLGYLTLFY